MSIRTLCLLAVTSASALADADSIRFDTLTGRLFVNGADAAGIFRGVPYSVAPYASGVRFIFFGDFRLLSGDTLRATGDSYLYILATNNLWVAAGARVDASADGPVGGPGGGMGGFPGVPFADPAYGGNVPGGPGGAGNIGNGVDGSEGVWGLAGAIGLTGGFGGPGSDAYGFPGGGAPPAWQYDNGWWFGGPGGAPGVGGAGGLGAFNISFPSAWASPGLAGLAGSPGGRGFDGNLGTFGIPGTNPFVGNWLSGGGGGSGGAAGNQGGMGGSGGGGGGGGAGGGAGGFLYVFGIPNLYFATGGSGGDGGPSGSGSPGGIGGWGGWGGGGGGGIELRALGRIVADGGFYATGGLGGAPTAGLPAEPGTGGAGGNYGALGQVVLDLYGGGGGNGGAGGAGGSGGIGGDGGAGGGGAGGTIKLAAAAIHASAGSVYDVRGGSNGRFVAEFNSMPSFDGSLLGGSREEYVGPMRSNPYLGSGASVPYLPDLIDGPDVYGLTSLTSLNFPTVVAAAPANAVAAFVVANAGVAPYADVFPGYRKIFFVNLKSSAADNPMIGTGYLGFLKKMAFGGPTRNPYYPELGNLPPVPIKKLGGFQVYALMIPASETFVNAIYAQDGRGYSAAFNLGHPFKVGAFDVGYVTKTATDIYGAAYTRATAPVMVRFGLFQHRVSVYNTTWSNFGPAWYLTVKGIPAGTLPVRPDGYDSLGYPYWKSTTIIRAGEHGVVPVYLNKSHSVPLTYVVSKLPG